MTHTYKKSMMEVEMLQKNHTLDTRIVRYKRLVTLNEIRKEIPKSKFAGQTVYNARRGIEAILDGDSEKKVIVVGPCSVHESESAFEYAARLNELSGKVSDIFLLVMRTYFEKPRTGLGWPGLINDPDINGKEDLNKGYRLARTILSKINDMGVPCATEYVDTDTPQLIGEFISWAAIGARTSYSQDHRRMASGLSSPVGFKNDTSGDVSVAINGILVAKEKGHKFPGIDPSGFAAEVETEGNPECHIVLRGGSSGPNYDVKYVQEAQAALKAKGLPPVVMVDCSHDNCGKDYRKQPEVFTKAIKQIRDDGNSGIIGIMVESHLFEGKKDIPTNLKGFDRSTLPYGISITDGCVSWDTTERLIMGAFKSLSRSTVYFT